MNIITKPDSGLGYGFIAIDDDTYDGPESRVGWGDTAEEAIADLKERLATQGAPDDEVT